MSKYDNDGCTASPEEHMNKHLCKLIKKGKMDIVEIVTKDPKYKCKKCGRGAHDRKNLCSPIKIV